MTTTNIVEIDDDITGRTKWRYSVFFLTVNTNRSDKALEPKFRDILKNDLLPNIIDFLKWTDANKSRMGELKDHIRPDTQISFKIEYGEKLKRLHTHIL